MMDFDGLLWTVRCQGREGDGLLWTVRCRGDEGDGLN